ncbi:hypothetical protein [Halorubrum sp. ARQ200]|uniref:hypothetical protein n=1 Tax=Halorubrum sp. ARQ200 TaxID=1855872 RepID=UPI0010F49208|nr:hypothetical protein [Halorubrum sp. ARQ200]TKX45175.1 hypothetical protein EXE50_04215 [Halorubrum sp. ARQ200]
MSVRDIPEVFREESRVFLLFPSVAHGYLYHTTGNVFYITLATIALIPPSLSFCLFYINGLGEINGYRDYFVITAERVGFSLLALYLILGVIHIFSVTGLILHMDHTDYIHVFLFLSSIFLSLVVSWDLYFGDAITKFEAVEKLSPTERIDQRLPNESNDNED